MEQLDLPDIDDYKRLLKAASPLIVAGLSTLYLVYQRWRNSSKYSSNAISDSIAVSLSKRRFALILFTALETAGWLYQFLIHFTDSPHKKIIDAASVLSLFVTWSGLFVLSFTSPKSNQYKDRHYNYIFVVVYAYLLFHSIYVLAKPGTLRDWDVCNITIIFVLLAIVGTTPQPYHPRDLQAAGDEKFEIKDGTVYRNNLKLSPEATASVFSWAAFQWINPLVVFGFHNTVTRENIYALTFQHLARTTYLDFVNTSKYIDRVKVLRRIYSSNKREIWGQFVFSTLACVLGYLRPYYQQKFLEYIEMKEDRPPLATVYLYIIAMFMVGVVRTLFSSIHSWMSRRWNIRTLIMLDSEIFSKTLKRKDFSGKISKAAEAAEAAADASDAAAAAGEVEDTKKEEKKDKKEDDKKKEESFSSVGKVTNLMSVDADKLADIPTYIAMLYNAPLETCLALVYLYNILGTASLVGTVVMIFCFPLTGLLTSKFTANYTALSAATDKRNNLITEMLQGIRMIKYFAWEAAWKEKVDEARRAEIKALIKNLFVNTALNIVFQIAPVMVTVTSFVWYTKVAGNELTASVAFVSITLFDMLRAPLFLIPMSISTFAEAHVSLKRISKYLSEPEVTENHNTETIEVPEGVNPQTVLARVGFEESVFQWHIEKTTDEDAAVGTNESTEEEVLIGSGSTDSTVHVEHPSARSVFQLKVPQFNFPTGKLSLICGPTGSGKSSFLQALLGEMDIVSGRAYLPSRNVLSTANVSKIDAEFPKLYLDKVAYVGQQPFLQHASIRDNILFGLPFDEERYRATLYQCALNKDLTIFADGDKTEIGERGISLSGGQKQRVSLARAVYSNAKTVLLDDSLSAVDAHTSKHIYQKCFMGDLLRGRTVILVTHQVKLCLPGAKYLVKIENGQALGCDTVENLKKNGLLQKLVGSELNAEEKKEEAIEDIIDEVDDEEEAEGRVELDKKQDAKKLVEDETSAKGSVKFDVYAYYLSACGKWYYWIFFFSAYVLTRLSTFSENWWIRVWAAAYDQSASTVNDTITAFATEQDPGYLLMNDRTPMILGFADTLGATLQKQNVFQSWVFEEKAPVNVDYYIIVYTLICLLCIVMDTFKNGIIYWGSVKACRTLFDGLLVSIIHAPMRFFDVTPVGRILNRFSKDVSVLDMQIARNGSLLVFCVTGIIACIIIISVITPQFLIVAVLISILYYIIGTFYLRISRELKRLNSVSRSPIYSHFTESVAGVTTIRAYGVEDQFMKSVYEKIDSFVAPFYFLWMSNRWLYVRIEFIGSFITLFAGIFLIINIEHIDAGMAGISLFYASSFLELAYWFIRQYTDVEMNFNSAERVKEYTEIEQEPVNAPTGYRPPAAWPTTAAVEVKDLVIRYAPELDTVLKGVTFSTKAHEKIGIVGRTGSGKSTIALSFFRFLEASSGSISIDGIDISTLGLHDLRSQLTIITQESVLFTGTIRNNLDPFNEHTDAEIWESLDRAHLTKPSDRIKSGGRSTPTSSSSVPKTTSEQKSAITSLNQQVSDGGSNFSQGQLQLLCLARALLKNSKLIIMDEATASVDFDTDSKIQTTIREEFTNSTLLCIAHRLRTVIDYDRILVLDQGQVIEYDTPYNLLTDVSGTGVFKSMCENSGEMKYLIKMATQANENKSVDEQSPDNHNALY